MEARLHDREDAARPLLKVVFNCTFDPYRAMPIFGELMTGLPSTDLVAIYSGWAYHFWNGISFGMIFALVVPRGGALPGLAWGLGLQALMMLAYPSFLQVRLDDPGFMAMGIVGHGLWGLVLGAGIRWYVRRPQRRSGHA